MENFVTVRFHDEELRFSSAENLVSKETLITDFLLPKDSLISLRYDMKDGTVGCLLSKDGTAFLLPPDWAGIKFYLKSDKAPSRPATPMNQAMSESSSSQKDSSKFKSYSRYLFYTRILLKDNGSIIEDDRMQYPCVPFQTTFLPKRYFVISTRHGSHSCLEEGDEIKVYNPEHKPFVVKVVYYEDDRDFIVFDSDVKLCDNMPFLGPVVGGTYYTLLGFADVKQDKTQSKYLAPCYTAGVIISSQPNSTGHVSGSSRGLSGFSGGPVFDTMDNSLIGICVSTDDLDDRETTFGKFTSDMINYCKETLIVRIMSVEFAISSAFAHLLSKKKNEKRKERKRRLEE